MLFQDCSDEKEDERFALYQMEEREKDKPAQAPGYRLQLHIRTIAVYLRVFNSCKTVGDC